MFSSQFDTNLAPIPWTNYFDHGVIKLNSMVRHTCIQYYNLMVREQSRRYIVPNVQKSFPNIRRTDQSAWFVKATH